jgi:hypothetical protein
MQEGIEVWRATILRWLARTSFLFAAGLSVLSAPAAIRSGIVAGPLKLAACAVVAGICSMRWGSTKVRARIFLGALALYAAFIPYDGGITGGIGLTGGLVVICGVVLLGRRDAVVLGAFVLAM